MKPRCVNILKNKDILGDSTAHMVEFIIEYGGVKNYAEKVNSNGKTTYYLWMVSGDKTFKKVEVPEQQIEGLKMAAANQAKQNTGR